MDSNARFSPLPGDECGTMIHNRTERLPKVTGDDAVTRAEFDEYKRDMQNLRRAFIEFLVKYGLDDSE